MKSPYWPTIDEVDICIRTEAEELADATVLAVHEPMVFERVGARESRGEIVSETDLLEHVKATRRPTPILGESGFGKSHVIRWLDIQLKAQANEDWHIIRIPKNASLRQALTALLDGLEGSVFDEARAKIDTVGADLETQDVAAFLIIFVGTRLRELYEEAKRVAPAGSSGSRQTGDDEEVEQRSRVMRHAKPGGLSSLLADPHFKNQLMGDGRCFFNIAKRLMEGSSDEELECKKYEVDAADLKIEGVLGDFSLEARQYIIHSQLMIEDSESRREAATLLNECLSDASRQAFQQLFQFTGGSFQDLFVAVREQLLEDGKTLFVLVEDMAAVSAIEDVLIDCLMQEDIRGGEQLLCPLHSAIAVTTGYRGYTNRRSTLSTRAGFEWYIRKSGSSEETTLARVQDLCGRYLNAARYGSDQLASSFITSGIDNGWPEVWRSGDQDFDKLADAFGNSPNGFPLFPFTANTLTALATQYCRPDDEIEFNPRKILKRILREPLMQFRHLYESGEFPPEEFADIDCPGNLKAELRRNLREDRGRAETLAAIWGFGAETIPELAYELPAEIAQEFNLAELATVLGGSERVRPTGRAMIRTRRRKQDPEIVVRHPVPGADDLLAIPREVDEYFRKKSIPQKEAKVIRKALFDALDQRKDSLSSWYGTVAWPSLRERSIYLISIPISANDPKNPLVNFGTNAEFANSTRALKYHQFIVAVLRRNAAAISEGNVWNYDAGEEDYCNYMNFLDGWIPLAAQQLVEKGRENAARALKVSYALGLALDPTLPNKKLVDRVDQLVESDKFLRERVSMTSGFSDWDEFLVNSLDAWNKSQKQWLDAYSTNRYGIEGDLVRKAVSGCSDITVNSGAQRSAQQAQREAVTRFPALKLLGGCTKEGEYVATLKTLRDSVSRLSSANQFKNMDGVTTAIKLKNRINKILDREDWGVVQHTLALLRPFEAAASIKALQNIDIGATEDLAEVLTYWDKFYEANRQRMINENIEHGAQRRKDAENEIKAIFSRFGEMVGNSDEDR